VRSSQPDRPRHGARQPELRGVRPGVRSEPATACEYCNAERPTLWGQWRLANVTVVDE